MGNEKQTSLFQKQTKNATSFELKNNVSSRLNKIYFTCGYTH